MSLLYEHDRFSVNEQCQPYRNEWMHNSDNADMVGVLHLFAGDITKCSLINTNWRKGSWGCHWSSLVKDYINFRRQPSPKLLENIERPSLILDGSKMDFFHPEKTWCNPVWKGTRLFFFKKLGATLFEKEQGHLVRCLAFYQTDSTAEQKTPKSNLEMTNNWKRESI